MQSFMAEFEKTDNLLKLSVIPLLSGLFVLITTTIFWYHSTWTAKETIFNFSIPFFLFLGSALIVFLASVLKKNHKSSSRQTWNAFRSRSLLTQNLLFRCLLFLYNSLIDNINSFLKCKDTLTQAVNASQHCLISVSWLIGPEIEFTRRESAVN